MDKVVILLKDRVGEKSESLLGGIIKSVVGRPSTVNILKVIFALPVSLHGLICSEYRCSSAVQYVLLCTASCKLLHMYW